MQLNIQDVFPPNTLRRLVVKTMWLCICHPVRLFKQLKPRQVQLFLAYFMQREFMLLEIKIAAALQNASEEAGLNNWRNCFALAPGRITRGQRGVNHRVYVGIFVATPGNSGLTATLDSLNFQNGAAWEAGVFCPPEYKASVQAAVARHALAGKTGVHSSHHLMRVLRRSRVKYVGFLQAGDALFPCALQKLLQRVTRKEKPDIIYGDELRSPGAKGGAHFFKPDWSPELLLSMNYIGDFFLLGMSLWRKLQQPPDVATAAGRYDLILQASEETDRITHVPELIYRSDRNVPCDVKAEQAVLQRALRRRRLKAEVIPLEQEGTFRIKSPVSGKPKVSILLLTASRDKAWLRKCIHSLVNKSTYSPIEVIVVDNSRGRLSHSEAKKMLGGKTPWQYIQYNDPFNYSRMNNLAAGKATGGYLMFLNDDTEVISPDWLEAMLEQAQKPGVGVVGAKLLYPNGAIQHGGVFLVSRGVGARHAFRYIRHARNSYHGFLGMARNCAAVTFACALVAKRIFTEVKGLDENLSVECNDIDFCLRVRDKGYRNVWTPFAVLYHKELVSRKRTHYPEDIAYYCKRWQDLIKRGDPYYNRNLSQDSDLYLLRPDFKISPARREKRRQA